MRLPAAALAALALLTLAAPAEARSPEEMVRNCGQTAKRYFHEGDADARLRYDGRRTDGTYTVGGDILLETRSAYVACAYAPNGKRLVSFHVDGRDRTVAVSGGHGGGGGGEDGSLFRVAGVPRDDVLNVRAGPSPRSRIVGALAEGDRVRRLDCRDEGTARWCRVHLLDEMGGNGWVNDRYLRPASHGGGGGGNRPPSQEVAGDGVSPPTIERRPDGRLVAVFKDGCRVRYDSGGSRLSADNACRQGQVNRADERVEARLDKGKGTASSGRGGMRIAGDMRGMAAAVFDNGCTVSFDERGRRIDATGPCNRNQISRAEKGVAEWGRQRGHY